MYHIFNVEIAKEYGILCAVLIENLWNWCEHNRANNKNFHDGRYWTFNSVKAFSELFPYATEKQIRSAIDKLEKEGIILRGNYNQSPYDRTSWYAFTEKGNSILQKGKIHLPSRANENACEGEPIPNINTNINTNINNNAQSAVEEKKTEKEKKTTEEILQAYTQDEKTLDLLRAWIENRKAKRAAMTERSIRMNLDKLEGLAKESNLTINDYLEQVVMRGWNAFYVIQPFSDRFTKKTAPTPVSEIKGDWY